jgi:hypothetical protein
MASNANENLRLKIILLPKRISLFPAAYGTLLSVHAETGSQRCEKCREKTLPRKRFRAFACSNHARELRKTVPTYARIKKLRRHLEFIKA